MNMKHLALDLLIYIIFTVIFRYGLGAPLWAAVGLALLLKREFYSNPN